MSKVILITGSSRGIGASLAYLSKRSGYKVILHGQTESKKLLDLSKELASEYVCFDIRNESEIIHAFSRIPKLDVLVNSAGLNISKPFDDLTLSDWHQIYNINVFGLSTVIKHALPIIRKSREVGRIVNIASVKGTYSAVGRLAYASSKSAVINLTSGLAKELAPDILVNCVSPGFTATEMTRKTWSDRIKKQVSSILLGRIADPEEIAEVIMFLCSEKCTYITGQNIIVDGGFGIRND